MIESSKRKMEIRKRKGRKERRGRKERIGVVERKKIERELK